MTIPLALQNMVWFEFIQFGSKLFAVILFTVVLIYIILRYLIVLYLAFILLVFIYLIRAGEGIGYSLQSVDNAAGNATSENPNPKAEPSLLVISNPP